MPVSSGRRPQESGAHGYGHRVRLILDTKFREQRLPAILHGLDADAKPIGDLWRRRPPADEGEDL